MNPATIAHVKKAVAEEFDVTELDLCSERGAREIARPRQCGYWLCRHLTARSLPQIGRAFGDRHYSTVMHGIKALERYMAADPALAAKVERARQRIVALSNQEVA